MVQVESAAGGAAERHVAGLPPLARRRVVGVGPDVPHDQAGHQERHDEGDQTPHQWQPTGGDEVELQGELRVRHGENLRVAVAADTAAHR